MKNLMSLLGLFIISLSLNAQGINFEHNDWDSVKAKAEKENKIIFIDFYTSWCGPCKQMAKNIFPLENVGDFYNKHFICYKIDAEKGEGPALAKQYGVRAFPTFIFTDASGNFLHQGAGSMPADDFIALGKDAQNPQKQLAQLTAEATKISKADMPAHLQDLYNQRLPYDEKFKAYIQSLTHEELISQQSFEMLQKYGGRAANGFAYETIVNNQKAFEEKLGKQAIENYFYRKLLSRVYEYKGQKKSYAPVFDESRKLGYELEEKIEATLVIYGYLRNNPNDFEGFVSKCKQFLADYEKADPVLKDYPVFTMCSGHFLRNQTIDAYVLQLLDELNQEKQDAVTRAYANIGSKYVNANLLDEGLEYYNKALNSANEKKQDIEPYEKGIEYVKQQILIKQKGDYTFNGKGFDEYNGLSVKLWHYSAQKAGKIKESASVIIKEGQFSLSGNTKTPLMGGFIIHNGDNVILKGDMVLEPGTFPISLGENNTFEVEQARYNWTVYNGWKTFFGYKEVQKKLWALLAEEVKGENHTKQCEEYQKQLDDMKAEYIEASYRKAVDPIAKVLLAFEGNLYVNKSGEDTSGDSVIKELQNLLPKHHLVKTMKKLQ